MANRRLIVKRRKSVRNIRKITRTMQLIATARFQAAFNRATATKPFTQKLAELVALGRKARAGFGSAAVLLLLVSLVWALPSFKTVEAATPQGTTTASGETWQPWSPQKVAELTAQGRPVFVDFTAAWCVTCQYNKRTTLGRAEVMSDFSQRKVALLRADWTRRDAAITAELTRLGRSGVPVYALYAPGSAAPRLLSEILSVDEVRGALADIR